MPTASRGPQGPHEGCCGRGSVAPCRLAAESKSEQAPPEARVAGCETMTTEADLTADETGNAASYGELERRALGRLPLARVLERMESARRAASTWAVVTTSFGALLWLWI